MDHCLIALGGGGENIRWVNSSGEEVDDGSLGTMDEFDDGGDSCVSDPHPDNPCQIEGVVVPPDDGGGDGDPDWGDDDDWSGDDPCWDCTGGGGGTDPGTGGDDCDPHAIEGGCEDEEAVCPERDHHKTHHREKYDEALREIDREKCPELYAKPVEVADRFEVWVPRRYKFYEETQTYRLMLGEWVNYDGVVNSGKASTSAFWENIYSLALNSQSRLRTRRPTALGLKTKRKLKPMPSHV